MSQSYPQAPGFPAGGPPGTATPGFMPGGPAPVGPTAPQAPGGFMSGGGSAVVDFAKLLQDAKSVSFDALPAGDYAVVCIETTGTISSTGKPMIKAKFTVEGGPHNGKRVFNQFVLTEDNPIAVAIFFRHMACFGLGTEYFAQLGSLPREQALVGAAAAMVGRRAVLNLSVREWPEGSKQYRNNVEQVKPGAGNGAPQVATGPAAPGLPQPGMPMAPQAQPQPVAAQPPPPPPAPPTPPPAPAQPQPTAAPVPQPAPAPVPQPAPVPAPSPPEQIAGIQPQPAQPTPPSAPPGWRWNAATGGWEPDTTPPQAASQQPQQPQQSGAPPLPF